MITEPDDVEKILQHAPHHRDLLVKEYTNTFENEESSDTDDETIKKLELRTCNFCHKIFADKRTKNEHENQKHLEKSRKYCEAIEFTQVLRQKM